MRARPRIPDDRVNVSPIHPLREALALIGGIGLIGAVIFSIAAFFVEIAAPLVPTGAETRLLKPVWAQLEDRLLTDKRAPVQGVEDLVARLASHWKGCPYTFRIGILDQDVPNALALPGGVILVTSGLIAMVESENELAFVLGHELGHFHSRDHLKALGRGVVFGLLLGAVGLAGGEAGTLLGTMELVTDRRYSRRQERAADRFGLQLTHDEYGHVAGSGDFLRRLAVRGAGEDAVADFMGTHPGSERRARELEELARECGWAVDGSVRPPLGTEVTPVEDSG